GHSGQQVIQPDDGAGECDPPEEGTRGRVGRPVHLREPRVPCWNHFLSRPPLGSLALRPGDSLTIPKMALSVGFIRFVSSTDSTRATGLLTLTLVGLIPTEHVCLVWTHCLLISPFSLSPWTLSPPGDNLLSRCPFC